MGSSTSDKRLDFGCDPDHSPYPGILNGIFSSVGLWCLKERNEINCLGRGLHSVNGSSLHLLQYYTNTCLLFCYCQIAHSPRLHLINNLFVIMLHLPGSDYFFALDFPPEFDAFHCRMKIVLDTVYQYISVLPSCQLPAPLIQLCLLISCYTFVCIIIVIITTVALC